MTESKTRLRLKVLAMLVVFMFAALTTRLWFLQVLAAGQFADLADQNQVRLVPIDPLRGEILDRNGAVLVGNRPSTVVLIDKLELQGREEEVLFRLSKLLRVPVQDLVDRLNSVRYLPYQPVPVAEDVSKQAVFYIREHQDQFPGVSYQLSAVRDYAQGTLAAHVLGYLGEVSPEQLEEKSFDGYRPGELVGKSGVESTYERWLHGTSGIREIQVNAQGQVLDPDFGRRDPVPGDNVVLSIDTEAQQIAEKNLALGIKLARGTFDQSSQKYLEAPGGAVVVMDPHNGQILAMASNPTYDPSIFLGGLSPTDARMLNASQNHQPQLNRAITGVYPAGSTFKPFVAAGAIKEGFASPAGNYNCPGQYVVPGDTSGTVFSNWNPVSQGYMTIAQALVVSCDTVFYQFGYDYYVRWFRSGKTNELMQKDLIRMGFGRQTGLDLPGEAAGLVPTAAYKDALHAQHPELFGTYYGWLPGDNVNLSIGQGYLLVTPLQLAAGYSAIANGGTLWRPHVGWKIETPDGKVVKTIRARSIGRLPVSKGTVAYLRDALTDVPRTGTAATAFTGFPLDRIPVAGKTGTADIVPKQPYSWFAAMAPANDPKYVVVAMIEEGGHGSTTAAPVVRRILEGLFGLQPNRLQAGVTVD